MVARHEIGRPSKSKPTKGVPIVPNGNILMSMSYLGTLPPWTENDSVYDVPADMNNMGQVVGNSDVEIYGSGFADYCGFLSENGSMTRLSLEKDWVWQRAKWKGLPL